MEDNLKPLIKKCLRPGHPHHVVGAGIGLKRREDGVPEPALTILVKKAVPQEELRSLVSRTRKEVELEVLEVGEIVALGKMGDLEA